MGNNVIYNNYLLKKGNKLPIAKDIQFKCNVSTHKNAILKNYLLKEKGKQYEKFTSQYLRKTILLQQERMNIK